ncbi:hypothetical protein V1517DRAFT_256783 [Lipomyces orientalis]|uniref:Uncharacterized protein n=1 Tax=Lipomyces orientalis TaxID=1233043 RepID=A0ACC3TTG2_9ASCO
MERTEYYPSPLYDVGLLIGDPFALATISVAAIGWFIALAASIAADVAGPYPQFSWWGIVYEFLVICGVIYVIGANAIEPYRIAIVGFTAAALVYTTNSTNNLVYTGRAADAAAAAGHILLSIINILWIFYFGTTSDAAPHAFIDSYALHREARYNDRRRAKYPPTQPSPVHSRGFQPMQQAALPLQGGPGSMVLRRPSTAAAGAYAGSSHNGSGLVLPQTGSATNLHSASGTMLSGGQQDDHGQLQQQQQQQTGTGTGAGTGTMIEPLDVPTEYPLRARAIYSYEANPEDANEISFVKDEILEVSDVSGRWWQARRANGEVGICPSNYVQLLDE